MAAHDDTTTQAILDELIARLDAAGTAGSVGGRIVTCGTTRYRVLIEPRPLAAFDPAMGVITCPNCGRTSLDGVIELLEDEAARRRLAQVRDTTAMFRTTIDRFDDDGTDTRLGCAHCGSSADFPPGLGYDWVAEE